MMEETSQLASGVIRRMPELEALERLIARLPVLPEFSIPNGELSVCVSLSRMMPEIGRLFNGLIDQGAQILRPVL